MKTEDFNFSLPEELIAQYPTNERGASRLMVLNRATGSITDAMVRSISTFIEPGTVMVFNDSKVRKARIYATAEMTGSQVEFIFLSALEAKDAGAKIEAKDEKKILLRSPLLSLRTQLLLNRHYGV